MNLSDRYKAKLKQYDIKNIPPKMNITKLI